MIENVSTQLTVFHCFAHCLLPGRAFASLYVLLFLEKEAEIGGRDLVTTKYPLLNEIVGTYRIYYLLPTITCSQVKSWLVLDKIAFKTATRPRGNKTWVQSQTQNKAQWLAACGHLSASSQSLHFVRKQPIIALYFESEKPGLRKNSSFITSRPVFTHKSSFT